MGFIKGAATSLDYSSYKGYMGFLSNDNGESHRQEHVKSDRIWDHLLSLETLRGRCTRIIAQHNNIQANTV